MYSLYYINPPCIVYDCRGRGLIYREYTVLASHSCFCSFFTSHPNQKCLYLLVRKYFNMKTSRFTVLTLTCESSLALSQVVEHVLHCAVVRQRAGSPVCLLFPLATLALVCVKEQHQLLLNLFLHLQIRGLSPVRASMVLVSTEHR